MSKANNILAVVAHNLGDAVIASGFIRAIMDRVPGLRWHVWCRPEVAFLFRALPGDVAVIANRFPIGTNKQFTFRACLGLIRSIFRLRRQKFDCSFDLLGDFRDVALARLAGSRSHLSPVWAEEHPFRRIIRSSPLSWFKYPVAISADHVNVYAAYEVVSRELLSTLGSRDQAPPAAVVPVAAMGSRLKVGIHPFASQDCRLWVAERWRDLASALGSRGIEVVAYSAPSERAALKAMFDGVLADEQLICGSLPDFIESVRQIDLLVGLDSFSVHVAHLAGVRSVLLNGPSDPRIWTPPSCQPVMKTVNCGSQPCLNVPTCVGTSHEYVCMKSLDVASVLATVLRATHLRPAGS